MNVGKIKELLESFNDETEIRIGAWRLSSSGNTSCYDYSCLSESNILFDKSAGKTVILIETDI